MVIGLGFRNQGPISSCSNYLKTENVNNSTPQSWEPRKGAKNKPPSPHTNKSKPEAQLQKTNRTPKDRKPEPCILKPKPYNP